MLLPLHDLDVMQEMLQCCNDTHVLHDLQQYSLAPQYRPRELISQRIRPSKQS